jgi:Flp pilus assembly protein TadG
MKRSTLTALLTGLLLMLPALSPDAQTLDIKRKPDLADAVAGSYSGDVISDSKGSSKDGVTVTVTRIGTNLVRVSSDYSRLPVVEVALNKVLNTIQAAKGPTVFLYDPAKNPPHLDVSFLLEVSWSGVKQ